MNFKSIFSVSLVGVPLIIKKTIPADPLNFIKRCVEQKRIFWTYHVNMRLKGRLISRQAILDSIECSKIIEEYPFDKYLPSYLVYAEYTGDIFHILFAVDIEEDNVRIITAYRPDPEEWEKDFKTRKKTL